MMLKPKIRKKNIDMIKIKDDYYFDWPIGLIDRVFADGPGDRGSIPGRVIPKTQKIVFDVSLLDTQRYQVWIKGKVEQSRERSSALHLGVVVIEKAAFGSPSTTIDYFDPMRVFFTPVLTGGFSLKS